MVLHDFERETVISYSNADDKAIITTFNLATINKLDKYCKDFPGDYQFIRDIIIDKKVEGKEYSCRKNLITISKPRTRKKLTDKEKAEVAQRLQKGRKKKKK